MDTRTLENNNMISLPKTYLCDLLDNSNAAIKDSITKFHATSDGYWIRNAIYCAGISTAIEAVLAESTEGMGSGLDDLTSGFHFDLRHHKDKHEGPSAFVDHTGIGKAYAEE